MIFDTQLNSGFLDFFFLIWLYHLLWVQKCLKMTQKVPILHHQGYILNQASNNQNIWYAELNFISPEIFKFKEALNLPPGKDVKG